MTVTWQGAVYPPFGVPSVLAELPERVKLNGHTEKALPDDGADIVITTFPKVGPSMMHASGREISRGLLFVPGSGMGRVVRSDAAAQR